MSLTLFLSGVLDGGENGGEDKSVERRKGWRGDEGGEEKRVRRWKGKSVERIRGWR